MNFAPIFINKTYHHFYKEREITIFKKLLNSFVQEKIKE